MGTVAAGLVGGSALAYLRADGWFEIRRDGRGRAGALAATLLATVLVPPVIVVDVLGGFPRDLNVAVPEALLFYPTIALVAEVAFHLAPLALLLGLLGRLRDRLGPGRTVWIAIVVASSIEPVFQVVLAGGESPTWAVGYVGVHLAAFGLVGLYLFKRYDFLTLYLFRIVYYLHWHILWGVARLELLFGAS